MNFERRDPEDPDLPSEPTAADVDAAFARIVAGWGERPRWPADEHGDDSAPTEEIPTTPGVSPGTVAGPVVQPVEPPVAESAVDDDHFVPPEPPPLPRPQPATVGAVLLFALGIVLLTIPGALGLSEQSGLLLGLLSISGAVVWLVTRLRQGPPTDSGWDDGAQL